MKKALIVTALMACCSLLSLAQAAVEKVRMLTQNNYLPGLPVLVRVEAYGADGKRDRDIWDIASIAAFYNMTNRLASATDMRPNTAYHGQAR